MIRVLLADDHKIVREGLRRIIEESGEMVVVACGGWQDGGSRLIHENCERRPHFDAGRFAEQFGDEGHRNGYCLYKLGCKGPETYNNCPSLEFNNVGGGVWPIGVGQQRSCCEIICN